MPADNSPKNLKRLRTSVLSRSFSIAKMGMSSGLKFATTKLTNSSMDDFLINQSESIAKELGQLKGSLMKAGQMLSMYGEYFLPPAANQFLKTLQSDSPPLDWKVISQYLATYLSAEQLSELEINPVSIGSASLGQVHKARIIATGEIIALKIQYPAVDQAIESDLKALRVILKMSKLLPDEINLDEIFLEVKEMLYQELDYENEARLTKFYGEKIKGDPRFVIPQVVDRYCGKKVLATTFIEGFKADHPLIKNLSQKRRNRLAENFLELYLLEIFEWNLVQTDPHLGNYKIQIDPYGDDKICLLDFGATRSFSELSIQSYRQMIKGAITLDEKVFIAGSRGLGFIIDSDPKEYVKAFTDFCNGTVEPFWLSGDVRNTEGKIKPDGSYNWKQTDLPGRTVKKALQFRNFELRSPPKEILFLDRKTSGVFMFLAGLEAEINARKIIDPFLVKV